MSFTQGLELPPLQDPGNADLQERYLISRTNFCAEFLTRVDDNEVYSLFMSDEAHFHLSGFVNKQNLPWWTNENPHQLHQKPLHSAKATVWYAVSSFGIISLYFGQ
jgi:hypothetical protein